MSEPNPNPIPTTEPTPTPALEKTFTQADVDAIVGKRIAKALKGMPDETELAAFRTWKESQKTEKERWDTLQGERDTARTELSTARAELEQLKREKILSAKGVADEDVEYYSFKIGKLVSEDKDFSTAAEEFFKNNPLKSVRVDMSGGFGGGKEKPTANETMNALLRGARK